MRPSRTRSAALAVCSPLSKQAVGERGHQVDQEMPPEPAAAVGRERQPHAEVTKKDAAGRRVRQLQPEQLRRREMEGRLQEQQQENEHDQHQHKLIEEGHVAPAEALLQPSLQKPLLRLVEQSPPFAAQTAAARTALSFHMGQEPVDVGRHALHLGRGEGWREVLRGCEHGLAPIDQLIRPALPDRIFQRHAIQLGLQLGLELLA